MAYLNAMQLGNTAAPASAQPNGFGASLPFNPTASAPNREMSVTADGAFRYTASQPRNDPPAAATARASEWRSRPQASGPVGFDDAGDNATGLPISLVDPKFQCIFPYPGFNAVQSTCFDTAYHSNENLVVAAPTASGKTVVFELALLRFFFPDGTPDGERMMRRRKAVYISPLRALCQERCMDWAAKFKEFDIKCGEVTGDTEPSADDISGMDIICTTPEKYNAITIKNYDNFQSVNRIGLILIDEVHILNEDRGPILEGLISRFKRLKRKAEEFTRLAGADEKGAMVLPKHADAPVRSLRLIALSATIPNVEDIAEWLEAKQFNFNESYRPVPLEFNVIPYPYNKTGFLFDNHLNFKLWDVIKKFSNGKPTLVFCATRKGCSSAATQLVKAANNELIRDKDRRQRLKEVAAQISVPGIADLVRQGVGVHTAALSYADRRLIENAFLALDIQVLCTTTTLAQGVNLPAHLVVIKSTQHWIRGKGYVDYPKSTMLQMIGRAGRPQYDNVGVAVVMTAPSLVAENRRLLGGTVVESHLMDRMIEHLNAEVVSGSVSDIADAIFWFKSTYLHVRLHKNPKAYGYEASGTDLEQIVMKLVTADLAKLRDAKVLVDDPEGFSFRCTDLGKIMARFNLLFSTVQLMASIPPNADLELLLQLVSKAGEFKDMTPKLGEKKILNVVNKGEKKSKDSKSAKDKDEGRRGVRWVIKEGVKDAHDKVFVLLQAGLEGVLDKPSLGLTFNLKMDAKNALQIGQRIARAFAEALLQRSDCFHAARNACVLEKMLAVPCWETGGPRSLLQVHGIGEKTAAELASFGVTSLMELERRSQHDLDVWTSRRNFGAKLKEALCAIPLYALDVTSRPAGLARTLDLRVIQQRSNFEPPTKWHRALLLAGDPTTGKILLNKSIRVNSGTDDDTVLPHIESWQRVHIHLIDRKFLGVDIMATIDPSSGPVGRRPATTATTSNANVGRPQALAPAARVAPVHSPELSEFSGPMPVSAKAGENSTPNAENKSEKPVAGKKRRPAEDPLLSSLAFMQQKMAAIKGSRSTVAPSAKRLKIGGLGEDTASVPSERAPQYYDAVDPTPPALLHRKGNDMALDQRDLLPQLPLQRALPAAKPPAAGAASRVSPYFAAPPTVAAPFLPFAAHAQPASASASHAQLQPKKDYSPPRDDGSAPDDDEWIPQRYAPSRPATNDSRVNVRVRTLSGGLTAGPAKDEAKRRAQSYNSVFEGLF